MTMSINAITTILQELVYQSSNRTSPAAKAGNVTQVLDLTTAAQKMAEAADTHLSTGQSGQINAEKTPEQPYLTSSFVPLPLRSELFPGARYFARLGEDKTELQASKEAVEEIFICLDTEKLGQMWIGLAWRRDFLSVTCFTQKETANQIMRENFPQLREDLKASGFKEVSLTSQTKNELGAIVDGQFPKFEEHFLNRTI